MGRTMGVHFLGTPLPHPFFCTQEWCPPVKVSNPLHGGRARCCWVECRVQHSSTKLLGSSGQVLDGEVGRVVAEGIVQDGMDVQETLIHHINDP